MIDTSNMFKDLNDYEKTLVSTALKWAIKNCHLYTAEKFDEARAISNTKFAKFKFEDENYTFSKEELDALNKALFFFHTELITRNIRPYDEDEETIDKMHISLKKISRQLEDFMFADQ